MAKPSLTNCPKHRPSAQRPRAQASDKRQTLVVSKRIQYVTLFQAVIAPGFHLFPFRTEKLSPAAPMVLRKRESRSPPPFFKSSRIPFSGPVPGEGFAFSRDSLPPCCFLHSPCCFPLPACCFPHPASLLRLFTFYIHLPWLCTVSFSVSFCSC